MALFLIFLCNPVFFYNLYFHKDLDPSKGSRFLKLSLITKPCITPVVKTFIEDQRCSLKKRPSCSSRILSFSMDAKPCISRDT